MKRGQRYATLLMLDREMFARGSWCGETHLQKGTFVLQELLNVASEYDFILYKHGPFSFELRDDLAGLQADDLMELVARHPGYGPTYLPTESANEFLLQFPKTTRQYGPAITFVADFLGSKGVAELERLATSLFIRTRKDIGTAEGRAAELVRLKPHVLESDALESTRDIDRFIDRAKKLGVFATGGV
jgi:hypothetical protein